MFGVDDKDIKRLEKGLKSLKAKALPFATRHTLNNAAFETMGKAKTNIREKMTLRNRWTEGSLRTVKSKAKEIHRQKSVVGSLVDYLEDQELGATKAKGGKQGTPIPTSYSAGQGEGTQPRTRLPSKPNKLSNIRLKRAQKHSTSKKAQAIATIKQAAKSGRKYVFLDLEKTKGIFKVIGGKRKQKIKMVHDLTRNSVKIPRNPWLSPAKDEASKNIPGNYKKALEFQLRRLGWDV